MATKYVYSDSEISDITVKYLAGVSLDVLAETYSKSVPSVRMKLVKLGVYQKSTTTKTATVSKSENMSSYLRALDSVGVALL
jgi:hypothetical protein